jgi:phosphoribosylamine--glycine ligase
LKVLVVGSGGREHALVRALARSPQRPELLAAPGNPGIGRDARLLPIGVEDLDGLTRAAREEAVDLVVIGPEVPLVAGLADRLAEAGITAFGPTAAAARLEGSKAHAKEVMRDAGVPTAAYATVDDVEAGMAAVDRYPVVLKFDGLAAGKGVVIAQSEDEARSALEEMLVARRFGEGSVVVEEHLEGSELSLLALCDGERAIRWRPRRTTSASSTATRARTPAGWGRTRRSPGSMSRPSRPRCTSRSSTSCASAARRFTASSTPGSCSPRTGRRCSSTTSASATPRRRPSCRACARPRRPCSRRHRPPGGLGDTTLSWSGDHAVTLVLASAGYPSPPRRAMTSPCSTPSPGEVDGSPHAGTRADGDALVTAGGRVLNVTALGPDRRRPATRTCAAADLIPSRPPAAPDPRAASGGARP